jgi:hypothetical protein
MAIGAVPGAAVAALRGPGADQRNRDGAVGAFVFAGVSAAAGVGLLYAADKVPGYIGQILLGTAGVGAGLIALAGTGYGGAMWAVQAAN